MKTTKILIPKLLVFGATIFFFSFDLPQGWIKAGSDPHSYEMGIEKQSGQDGKNAVTIKSINKKPKGFGTLMQQCKPDKYLGRRVRMTGLVKTENVNDWAGLWLRVDQAGTDAPLAFDNMENRPIKGTTNWTKYEIVVDVPVNASLLAYGALMGGTGQIWFDKVSIEIVDNTVETTDLIKSVKSPTLPEPTNLDFEN